MFIFSPFGKNFPLILYAGKSELIAGESYSNTHIPFEIALIEQGSGFFQQGKLKPSPVKSEDLILIRPEIPFVLSTDKNNSIRSCYIALDYSFLTGKSNNLFMEEGLLNPVLSIINDACSKGGKFNLNHTASNTGILMKQAMHELSNKSDPLCAARAKNYFQLWLIALAELIRNKGKNLASASQNIQISVNKAIDLIHADISKKWTLKSLAGKVHLSPFYFARIFKKHTGYSPMNYINICRIEKAKKLLLEGSNYTFESIASKVGLGDAYYFSSVFKKVHGISPSAYKRQFLAIRNQGDKIPYQKV